MPAICFILAQLLFQPLWAAAPMEIPVTEGDHLVLVGLEAQVKFTAQPGSAFLKVSGIEDSGSEGAFTATKKNNIIEIKMNEYTGKKAWLNILSKNQQMKKIDIAGPALPVEISLRRGSVVTQNWNKDFKVSMTQGRFSSLNGNGSLEVDLQKGDINIQDHTGRVDIDSYHSTVALKNIQGDIDADLFSGQAQFEKIKGFLALTTQQGNSKVNQSNGTLQFENGRGSLVVQGFQGRVEGKNTDGSIHINMTLDSDTDIKSKAGKITVQLPPGSGAHLNLSTSDGEIIVPPELKVNKSTNEKSFRGHMRGDAQKGSVFVRSQEGIISVK
ncbi:MAG: DUF4097 family beta strand repeat-containing protein [Bdellovibrio sp.]